MTPFWAGVVYFACAVSAWLLTDAARRYALARNVMDMPNERSAHRTPMPRGGGVSIVLVTMAVTIATFRGPVGFRFGLALLGGGIIVSLTGWIDDTLNLRPLIRFLAHVTAASWAVAWIGGYSTLQVGSLHLNLGAFGFALSVLFIVWFINLYNFMDGIDGLAAVNALTVGVVGAVLLASSGDTMLYPVLLAIAGGATGFLRWNWSPATIFMGDVGSGFLGFAFATIALMSDYAGRVPLAIWVVLLGVFVFDATVTLIRRVLRHERWYAAHHNHAYQRMVRAGRSHAAVSGALALVNLALGALAFAAYYWPWTAAICAVIAVVGLLALYVFAEKVFPMSRATTAD